jgi:hypothetical protein
MFESLTIRGLLVLTETMFGLDWSFFGGPWPSSLGDDHLWWGEKGTVRLSTLVRLVANLI